MDDYSTRAVIVWPFILAARSLALLVVLGIAAGCEAPVGLPYHQAIARAYVTKHPDFDAYIVCYKDNGDREFMFGGWMNVYSGHPDLQKMVVEYAKTHPLPHWSAEQIARAKTLNVDDDGHVSSTWPLVPQRSPVVAKETALRGGNGENRPAGVRDAGGGPVGGDVTDGSGFDSRRTPAAAPPLNRSPVVAENPKGTEATVAPKGEREASGGVSEGRKPIAAQRPHKADPDEHEWEHCCECDKPLKKGDLVIIPDSGWHAGGWVCKDCFFAEGRKSRPVGMRQKIVGSGFAIHMGPMTVEPYTFGSGKETEADRIKKKIGEAKSRLNGKEPKP